MNKVTIIKHRNQKLTTKYDGKKTATEQEAIKQSLPCLHQKPQQPPQKAGQPYLSHSFTTSRTLITAVKSTSVLVVLWNMFITVSSPSQKAPPPPPPQVPNKKPKPNLKATTIPIRYTNAGSTLHLFSPKPRGSNSPRSSNTIARPQLLQPSAKPDPDPAQKLYRTAKRREQILLMATPSLCTHTNAKPAPSLAYRDLASG